MNREDAMSLAWIALDGLLLRNFFSLDEYTTDRFDETLHDAFRWYHRFLSKGTNLEEDLRLLLHQQNFAERELRDGSERFAEATPVGMAKDIVETAATDRWRGITYEVFTACLPAVRAYDKALE